MIAVAQDDVSQRLLEAYQGFVRALELRLTKVGYVLALCLVPAAVTLDLFVYPELIRPIIILRLICDAMMLPCFGMLFTRMGRRYTRTLATTFLLVPMLSICWMIYASEGSDSPYYAGLNLVMLAACLLTTFGARDAMCFCAVVLASYCFACFLHAAAPPATTLHKSVLINGNVLVNNLYFLAATALVCVTSCHFSSLRRFEDFRLKHELDANNTQLASTLKKLQDTEVQLVQSEKMNALGKLSAGLLHEINNPLNFTFMALQIAQQDAEDDPSLKETLGDIHQGMSRIRSVISDLRAFAYPSKLSDAEPFKLSEALTTALRLTAHEIGEIPIEQIGVAETRVLGSKTQIVHVLMNLVVNAVHALREKPTGREPRITIECVAKGGRTEIAVRDNGTGVAATDLHRLLEPFFTTKEPGKGTGLGLSICHTIVRNHGGDISITTDHASWTRVAFDLAAAPECAPAPINLSECRMTLPNTGEKAPASGYAILYVDDEEQALKYFRRGFEKEFPVLTASSVPQALALLEKEHANVGVLLTDHRMPGQTGVELLARVRHAWPDIVRILVTAYSDIGSAIDAVNSGSVFKYLTKPVDLPNLKAVLREAMGVFVEKRRRDTLLDEKLSTIQQMVVTDRVQSMAAMASGISHHIRNSLTAMTCYFEELDSAAEAGTPGAGAPEGYLKNLLALAKQDRERLARIAQDVSQHVSVPRFEIKADVELAPLLRQAAADAVEALGGRPVSLDVPAGFPNLKADPAALVRMFSALIACVAGQARPGGAVSVTVLPIHAAASPGEEGRAHSRDTAARARIRLRGEGLDWQDEQVAAFFSPFSVSSTAPARLGMGLLETYYTAIGHGGELQTHAKAPLGPGFEVSLALDPEAARRDQSAGRGLALPTVGPTPPRAIPA